MSFSCDLWNGFDVIKSAFTTNQKNVKTLLDILNSYSLLQKDYYKGISNIIQEIKEIINPNSILEESINLLLFSFNEENELHKIYSDNLNKIINNLKEELEKITNQINTYFNENIKNRESFNLILNNLILKQDEYYKSCNELCTYLLEEEVYEIIKDEYDNNENKDLFSILSKKVDKLKENKETDFTFKEFNEDKKNSLLNIVLDNKNEYIDYIEESDREREKFNKETETLLNNLQKDFKSLIFLFQNAINNYAQYKINTYNDIIELVKYKKNEKYSKINYKKETNDFILKNATKMFPMIKLEFLPYKINKKDIIQKLSKFSKVSKTDHNRIILQINDFIKDNKLNINEEEFINLISSKKKINKNIKAKTNKTPALLKKETLIKSNFIFINDFVFKLCSSSEVKMENDRSRKDYINKTISDESYMYNNLLSRFMDLISVNNIDHFEYLKTFVKLVTYYRSKGFFVLNESSYKTFVIIFSFILVNYKTSYNIIKNIIVFSQTFYKIDNNSSNKIYILNGLKNHATFNDIDTWHRVINYNLSLSIKNSNSYCLNIVNKEEYLKNLNKIVINSIISYLYDLKLSTIENQVYEEVKNFYITIYELDKEFVEKSVENLFGEVNNENKKEKKIIKNIDKNENNIKNEENNKKEGNNKNAKNIENDNGKENNIENIGNKNNINNKNYIENENNIQYENNKEKDIKIENENNIDKNNIENENIKNVNNIINENNFINNFIIIENNIYNENNIVNENNNFVNDINIINENNIKNNNENNKNKNEILINQIEKENKNIIENNENENNIENNEKNIENNESNIENNKNENNIDNNHKDIDNELDNKDENKKGTKFTKIIEMFEKKLKNQINMKDKNKK